MAKKGWNKYLWLEKKIIEIVTENPGQTTNDIKRELERQGIKVNWKTIKNRLDQMGKADTLSFYISGKKRKTTIWTI